MCGIAGVLNFNGTAPDYSMLEAMSLPLAKRGPDGGKIVIEGPLGFVHRRLAIIDLDARSDQPMIDVDTKNWIVFNGTIYNYPELREILKSHGHTFRTSGDTEVILKAYAQWGEDCVKHLIGMFAFALFDVKQQKMLLARDRLGIKPLYYAHNSDAFYFASNVQSLLTTRQINTDISAVGMHFQFTLHAVIPAPNTILEGIKKVKPAHIMWVDLKGQTSEKSYWELQAVRTHSDWDQQDWQNAIEDKLRVAVRRRMNIADVPVGILLSGGLDSSLLVALAVEEGARDLRTFSIGFEDHPDEAGSEFEFSDQVVARYQTQHHKYHIPNEQALTRLPEAILNMAEPIFGQDAIGFYLLSEQVSQSVRVVQSGQGADEVFAGYFWYPQMANSTEKDPLKRFSEYYFDRDHAEWLQMVGKNYQIGDVTGEYIRAQLTKPGADTYLDQVLRLDSTVLITDDPVKRVDNMTMAHGLEARVPFLDHELVELAMAMPPEYKLSHEGKGILKQIARGKIPDAVIDRPKAYFPMPALKYVRGDFYAMMHDALTSQKARERGIFNPDYIARLLKHPEAPENFTRIQGSKLWHCALLEMWLQANVD